MMPSETDLPVFKIGLTLAGAVSAGAYSAGVTDRLIQSVEAHNRRALAGGPDAPGHLVVIKAMSGASAGSVTLAGALASLLNGRNKDRPGAPRLPTTPFSYQTEDGANADYEVALPELHDIWINHLALWQENDAGEMDGLLALDDLETDAPLRSLLNGGYIDRVAGSVLDTVTWKDPNGPPLVSFAADLDLFLITTNLNSVPYAVQFRTEADILDGQSEFRMANHCAVRHFCLHGLGTTHIQSAWLESWSDEGIALCPPESPEIPLFADKGSAWSDLKLAAIASAAFPIGLTTRYIAAEAEEFGKIGTNHCADGGARPLNIDPTKVEVALPDFGPDTKPKMDVNYHAIDGGVLNNEPFEYARFTIRDRSDSGPKFLAPNERDPEHADRAVILIDAFPEGPDYRPTVHSKGSPGLGVTATIRSLFEALINHARFKPSEIVGAADPDTASRFIIRPNRTGREGQSLIGKNAIASGTLLGFGGFVQRKLRQHDFVLGQINCDEFLKNHLVLPASNSHIGQPDRGGSLRVIDPGPDFLEHAGNPRWPTLKFDDLVQMTGQLRKRIKAVGPPLLKELGFSGVLRILALVAWYIRWPIVGIALRLERQITGAVLTDFLSSGVLIDPSEITPEKRGILMALVRSRVRILDRGGLISQVQKDGQFKPESIADSIHSLVCANVLWKGRNLWRVTHYGLQIEKPRLAVRILIKLGFMRSA